MCEKQLKKNASEIKEPVDLLGRQSFVDRMISVCSIIAEGKKDACYAINGEWGAGKSFVLDMFEQQISLHQSEETARDKYLVFRYNCWQYDYYEEPIIAIVAAIIDAINEKEKLIAQETREKVRGVLTEVGKVLFSGFSSAVEKKTGVNIKEITETVKSGIDAGEEKWRKDNSFDPFFEFKKTMTKLKQAISELARDQTLLFVVDEMDRCLPEYAIKVLERLHHVFDEIRNVQVIIAVDKRQLERTVTRIYGNGKTAKQYLAKFIDFELYLARGEINGSLSHEYQDYFNCFTFDSLNMQESENFCMLILKDIDMRSCKAILEKSALCHNLLNGEENKLGSEYLCIEVFLTLLKHYGINISKAKQEFDLKYLFVIPELFMYTGRTLTGLAVYTQQLNASSSFSYISDEGHNNFIYCGNLNGIILGCYRTILGFTNDFWCQGTYGSLGLTHQDDYKKYVRAYWKLLKALY